MAGVSCGWLAWAGPERLLRNMHLCLVRLSLQIRAAGAAAKFLYHSESKVPGLLLAEGTAFLAAGSTCFLARCAGI